MANWSNLKAAIANTIKTNGNQEITGQVLQSVLTSMVNALGEYPDFAGIATPTTAPGVPDGPVFFIAATPGAYPNFGNIVLNSGEIATLSYNGSTWVENVLLRAATAEGLELVQNKVAAALSSNPYFSHIETAQVTVSQNSVSPTANYTVVYLSANGRFAAYYRQTYYATWQAKGIYSAHECYGPAPIIGKIYVGGSSLYTWDGSELTEIDSIRQLLEFEAQVVQSGKGVFFTEDNGIEVRLGKGLALDDSNAIAINDNEVVTPEEHAPKLTAGFADNLVGRGEATPETISFRQSAGNISVEDGTARIVKIKGNSVYWTQIAEQSDVTLSKGSTLVSDSNYRAYTDVRLSSIDITHKYLVFCKVVCTDKDGLNPKLEYSLYSGIGKASFNQKLGDPHYTNGLASAFFTPQDASYNYVGFYCRQGDTKVYDDKEWSMYVQVHDLTLMFGAGKEPTTTADFLSRTQYFAGKSHNPGEYIHLKANAIKTVGLNAWDEKWTINLSQGSVYSNVYVPVISGKKYFFSSTREGVGSFYVSVRLYDKNKQRIGDVPNGIYFNTSKNNPNFNNPYTIPADVAYIAFNITPSYGAEYKNDICIHLEHTGYKNGTYEPYKEFIRPIPIADIKDSNGAQLFPEGLCSIGENVYDEITPTKAIKRVGVKDLGDLTWILSGTEGDGLSKPLMYSQNFQGAVFSETANAKANILCGKYQTYSATEVFKQSVGIGLGGETDFPNLYIYDPDFIDAETFKSAMKGVKMYFQLAEPIEVEFDEPLNLDYQVWDFGTEGVVSDGATAPLKADIIYQFNAVDRIRENSKNTSRPQEAGTIVNEGDKRFVYKGERVAINKTSIDVVADVNIQTAANAVQVVTKSWGESAWNVRTTIKPATSGAAGVMSNVQCQSLEELGSFLSKLKTAFGTTDLDTIVSKLATLK